MRLPFSPAIFRIARRRSGLVVPSRKATVSLVISYGIVFEAGFGDQQARREQQGILQHPVTETMAGKRLPSLRT